ncbi:hypothetical protein CBR_g28612 [Chara braunii]|uniref:Uncharacterized protein n=1 Tax=Chara braunii TaxID=69332 RepID=A0A388L9D5_CHABU|nr:hypothetical protein CBR_g28612 [Chara braunii]|eukprot:GBG78898.1 hypothetical protein CBR_g28612 [Chara braunii]
MLSPLKAQVTFIEAYDEGKTKFTIAVGAPRHNAVYSFLSHVGTSPLRLELQGTKRSHSPRSQSREYRNMSYISPLKLGRKEKLLRNALADLSRSEQCLSAYSHEDFRNIPESPRVSMPADRFNNCGRENSHLSLLNWNTELLDNSN